MRGRAHIDQLRATLKYIAFRQAPAKLQVLTVVEKPTLLIAHCQWQYQCSAHRRLHDAWRKMQGCGWFHINLHQQANQNSANGEEYRSTVNERKGLYRALLDERWDHKTLCSNTYVSDPIITSVFLVEGLNDSVPLIQGCHNTMRVNAGSGGMFRQPVVLTAAANRLQIVLVTQLGRRPRQHHAWWDNQNWIEDFKVQLSAHYV